MESPTPVQDISRFNIIFKKLEEAKKEQDFNFNIELEVASETNKTISFFKEYQDSMMESSFTILTKS
jgi:hypothetical protein